MSVNRSLPDPRRVSSFIIGLILSSTPCEDEISLAFGSFGFSSEDLEDSYLSLTGVCLYDVKILLFRLEDGCDTIRMLDHILSI